jgi:hypothetical protein
LISKLTYKFRHFTSYTSLEEPHHTRQVTPQCQGEAGQSETSDPGPVGEKWGKTGGFAWDLCSDEKIEFLE